MIEFKQTVRANFLVDQQRKNLSFQKITSGNEKLS